MKPRSLAVSIAVLLSSVTALISCSTPGPSGVEKTDVIETPDGAILVDTFTGIGTIKDIDNAKRKVTLLFDDGYTHTYTCGPEVTNLAQLQAGDLVRVKFTEGAALFIGRGPSPNTTGTVALAPIGAKPGSVTVETMQIVARVLDVDPKSRRVTLQLPDLSTKKVRVGKQVDLTNISPGDDATVQVAEGLAVTVEKQ